METTTEGISIQFRGILSNVDSSILQLAFDNGFRVESFSEEDALKFFTSIENLTTQSIGEKYFLRLRAVNHTEHKVYSIHNSFEGSLDTFPCISKFDNKFVRAYLEPKIRLLRLYKEGDIRMPIRFYYKIEDDKIQSILHGEESGLPIGYQSYHIEASELAAIQHFIESTEFPFKMDFLQLAFENFELSYQILDVQLSFLVLMIGLEALLNPSTYEVKYRVSRNMAVLLGHSKSDAELAFKDIKDMYDKRSEIVHSGKRTVVKQQDMLKLREYLRNAIKEIYMIGKGKDELVSLLTTQGFGEKIPHP